MTSRRRIRYCSSSRTIRTTRGSWWIWPRRKDFKVLVAGTGERALSLAAKHKPTAISLDVFLPDMLGWTVLNQLKRNPETRHIPVQLLTVEDERQYGLERGAFSFVTKTITTESLEEALERLKSFTTARPRRLLVVEDNAAERLSITELLGSQDIEIATAESGSAALELMREGNFDCVVLDLRSARHLRVRAAGGGTEGRQAARDANRRLHRAGAHAGGGG